MPPNGCCGLSLVSITKTSCEADLSEKAGSASNVSFSVLHEGALPHVLENMADMRPLDQRAGTEEQLEPPSPRPAPEPRASQGVKIDEVHPVPPCLPPRL